MQQGSWVDGPGSIQTPTLQLCPVPFPSFSFPLGPITEPLNTHRLTDTQIQTSSHTNTNRYTTFKHIYTVHKAAHTHHHKCCLEYSHPPDELPHTAQLSIKSHLLHNLKVHTCCVCCPVSVTTASSLVISMMLKQCIYWLPSLLIKSFSQNAC